MSQKKEVHFCPSCGVETQHIVVLVRKPTGFENASNRKFKEFVAGAIKAWFVGPFIASMDDFSRHLICENCGRKFIEE
ncbi:hypothetical protein [Vibrio sp. CAU 1672]|uniref:hypothetical protein n=1 Tax=Vibrio sp. CAU 1672 TaxID=3032594 RepID=UPI0023DCBF4C|nr:hypothetical protein [Vibrio sp. CAU 1672]MDF2154575.1 hypothetical protein [Vibrio sp. CAU 1672]